MMDFELYDNSARPLMSLSAENEDAAWKKLRRAGIRNRSKLMRLIQID